MDKVRIAADQGSDFHTAVIMFSFPLPYNFRNATPANRVANTGRLHMLVNARPPKDSPSRITNR